MRHGNILGRRGMAVFLKTIVILLVPSQVFAWDCSAWRKDLLSLSLHDVKVDARNEKSAWSVISWGYSIRLIRVDNVMRDLSEAPFTFHAAQCSVEELLNTLSKYYNRAWEQDPETGTLWVYPNDFDLKLLDGMTAEFKIPVIGAPMRSELLDPYFNRKHFEGVYSRVGPRGVLRGPIPIYRFANYAVDIPRGTHSLRAVLNFSCVASPSQAFLVEYYPSFRPSEYGTNAIQEIVVTPDSIERPPSFPPAVVAYAAQYLDVKPGESLDKPALARRLSNPNPDTRRAAQHYVELTEKVGPDIEYVPDDALTLEENLWYALAYDRYDKMSHEGYPRVSLYIGEHVSDDFLRTSPNSHLVLLLGLERARIERDYAWLQVLSERKFSPEELRGLEHEVLYIARRNEVVWKALRDPNNTPFIDTGGWTESFMQKTYPEPFVGPFNRPHPKELATGNRKGG